MVIDNKIIEGVNLFNYLGYMISYERYWTLTTNYVTTFENYRYFK